MRSSRRPETLREHGGSLRERAAGQPDLPSHGGRGARGAVSWLEAEALRIGNATVRSGRRGMKRLRAQGNDTDLMRPECRTLLFRKRV